MKLVSVPIAYMPLVDAAPLIVAQEISFAEAEGLSLDLIAAPSWSSVRDMLAFGQGDAAHLLSPIPVARALGLGGVSTEVHAGSVLSVNGNVIGASHKLEALLHDRGFAFDFQDAAAAGAALAGVAGDRLTICVPFPLSMHVELLELWTSATPLSRTKIDIRTVPPPLMAQALAVGEIDAFCVAEPWGSVAVENGGGALLIPGNAIWAFAPGAGWRGRTSARRRQSCWFGAHGPRDAWIRGAEREAAQAITAAIAPGGAPEDSSAGSIALVGAGPGARDLLTLRAVERLQEADVIFYDRLVEEDVLELARRDAERVFVGKHVVRLKSGDPGIFGRAGEEIDAARDAGIPVEVVPGVTAASAAAASFGQSLTQRGETDTLVLATGTGHAEAPFPDCLRHAGPGTSLAIYMGVQNIARICSGLTARGFPESACIEACVEVSKPSQRRLSAPVRDLPALLRSEAVSGCAILLVKWPKTAASKVKGPAQIGVSDLRAVSA